MGSQDLHRRGNSPKVTLAGDPSTLSEVQAFPSICPEAPVGQECVLGEVTAAPGMEAEAALLLTPPHLPRVLLGEQTAEGFTSTKASEPITCVISNK